MDKIENLIDLFQTEDSGRYHDNTIWNEPFAITESLAFKSPHLYDYYIRRLRDLKNCYDYAIQTAFAKKNQNLNQE